ncbi:hypothetical protein HOB30_04800, partial [Candidatus Falkowbacteria bacterium]|nr:hypothetical protein [Candidatus Falkowbacteria bacterium]
MKRVIFFSFLLIAICGNAMAQEPVQSAQPAKISIVFTPIATEIALADALAANHTSVVLFGLPKVDNPQSDIDRTWNAINGKVEEVKTYLGPHQADSRLNFFYYEGSRTDRELAARFKLLVRTV